MITNRLIAVNVDCETTCDLNLNHLDNVYKQYQVLLVLLFSLSPLLYQVEV